MSNLLSLQKKFLDHFRSEGSYEKYIKVNGPSPQSRLSVYHNNTTQALRNALAATYPLTWKLVGEDCANGAAYTFIRMGISLPTCGNLEDWGGTFPDFLEHFPPTQSLPYLPDFARIEWLKHIAYGAENLVPLKTSDFENMDSQSYAQLILKFSPSAHLFSSAHPLDQIMAVVEGEIESLELENKSANALIIRPYEEVKIYWISDAYFAFFSFIYQGHTLMEALEKIREKEFQFHEILSFSFQNGLFSNYAFTS